MDIDEKKWWDLQSLEEDLREIRLQLKRFLKQPHSFMKDVPDWEWRRVLLAQVLFTFVCGLIKSILELKVHALLYVPILSVVVPLIFLFASSLFFYYTFQVVHQDPLDLRKIFNVTFFSNVPFFVILVVSGYFPPLSFLGLATTAFLLIVGFVENFHMQLKTVLRLISILYFLFFLIWLLGRYESVNVEKNWKSSSGSSSLQAPEVELGK